MKLLALHVWRSDSLLSACSASWSFALRRYNVLTASAWDNTVSTADTPSYATRLAVQTANLLINVQELCDRCKPTTPPCYNKKSEDACHKHVVKLMEQLLCHLCSLRGARAQNAAAASPRSV